MIYSWGVCAALWSPNPRGMKRQTKGWSCGLSAAEYTEVYSPLGTSFLEEQRICSMLCQKLVLRQELALYFQDCTWCCLLLSHSSGRGHLPAVFHFRGMIPANQSLCLNSVSTNELMQSTDFHNWKLQEGSPAQKCSTFLCNGAGQAEQPHQWLTVNLKVA